MKLLIFLGLFPLTLCLPQSSPDSEEIPACQVQNGNGDIKDCAFPFIYEGKTYFGCTKDEDPEDKLWCSTATDPESSEHITGKNEWGHCSEECHQNDDFKEDNDIALDAFNVIKDATNDLSNRLGNCPCVPVNECRRGRDLLGLYKNLGKGHPYRRSIAQFLRLKQCKSNDGLNSITCCGERLATKTSSSTTTTTTTTTVNLEEIQNQESPSWRPTNSDCGTSSAASSITGGNITKLGEINYMALLGYNTQTIGKAYLCGGSVVNKFYVLTAAHCVFGERGERNDPIEIVLGEYNVNQDPDCTKRGRSCLPKAIRRVPSEIKIHEKYDPNDAKAGYDLALIKVNEPIPLYSEDGKLSSVIPVCLPWNSNDPGRSLGSGTSVTVTGWGRLTNDYRENRISLIQNKVSSPRLMKAALPIVSTLSCNANTLFKRANYQVKDDIQLCAGAEEGIDSCSGDSGGPLVYHEFPSSPKFQVGIVSFGSNKCGTEGVPGVYTKVTAFMDWIGQNIN